MSPDLVDRVLAASRPTDADVDAELSAAVRAQILDDVLAGAAPGTVEELVPRHTRRRWLGLAAAAAAVAVTGAVGARYVRLGTVAGVPAGTPAPVSDPVTAPSPVAPSTPAASSPPSVLESLAQTAAAQPALTGTRLRHVRSTETSTGQTGAIVRDIYTAADGWAWSTTRTADGRTVWNLWDSRMQQDPLPADPVAMEAALRRLAKGGDEVARVYHGVEEFFLADYATPDLKAAGIRVLARLAANPTASSTRVVAAETVADGRPVVELSLVGAPDHGPVTLVLDRATAELVASRSTLPGGDQVVRYQVTLRETVDALPAEVVAVLGTARVEKEVER